MAIWLTRITPDLRNQRAVADMSNVVSLHETIMRLFPQGLGPSARSAAGLLFRTEETPGGGVNILAQSTLQPDAGGLPKGYGTLTTKPLDPLLDAIREGFPVRYRLIGNATRKLGRNTAAGKPMQVVPLNGDEAEAWWQRQAEQAGLKLRDVIATPLTAATGVRLDKPTKTRQPQLHARTRFDGTAVIVDPAMLRERVLAGIGRAKTYGCGLLTLAPAR